MENKRENTATKITYLTGTSSYNGGVTLTLKGHS